MTPVVVGLGQDAAGDDGVGLVVARHLRARTSLEIRESTDASLLLTLLEDGRHIVVVDAVVGGGEPGDVLHLSPAALGDAVTPLSSHGVAVKSALDLGRILHGDGPVDAIELVGIVIERPDGLRTGLSAPVASAVERAASMALELANHPASPSKE